MVMVRARRAGNGDVDRQRLAAGPDAGARGRDCEVVAGGNALRRPLHCCTGHRRCASSDLPLSTGRPPLRPSMCIWHGLIPRMLTAGHSHLKSRICEENGLAELYLKLHGLHAGIKPNVSAFGADQFDESDPQVSRHLGCTAAVDTATIAPKLVWS